MTKKRGRKSVGQVSSSRHSCSSFSSGTFPLFPVKCRDHVLPVDQTRARRDQPGAEVPLPVRGLSAAADYRPVSGSTATRPRISSRCRTGIRASCWWTRKCTVRHWKSLETTKTIRIRGLGEEACRSRSASSLTRRTSSFRICPWPRTESRTTSAREDDFELEAVQRFPEEWPRESPLGSTMEFDERMSDDGNEYYYYQADPRHRANDASRPAISR